MTATPFDQAAVEPLINELMQADLTFQTPWENILARIGLSALQPVIELTESTDELQRRAAIAILGDMLEMGEAEESAHTEILELALNLKLPTAIVGPRFQKAYQKLSEDQQKKIREQAIKEEHEVK